MTPEERQAKIARIQKIEHIKMLESQQPVSEVQEAQPEPQKKSFGWKDVNRIMTSGAQPLRRALYGEGDSGSRKIELANALVRMVGAPFNLGIEGLKQIPEIGEGLATPFELPGQAANAVWQGISPSVLPTDISPEKRSALNELMPTLGTIAAFKGAQSIPKVVGGTARTVLPQPERVYSVAAKLGGIGEEAEAATYGVKNRVKMGGSYEFQPKNYEANRTQIKNVVETKLNPEIESIQKSGVTLDRSSVLAEVNDFLKKNYAGLKTPVGKARYAKVLESLNEEFKQGGEKITPKEMQEGKVAVHREATYDTEGQMTNEFNKAVAHVYRKKLEEWNPKLKGINKELQSLGILGESIYSEAMKSSKNLPKGESGLPFYIAISNPIKGGMVGGARALMGGASPLSKTAFAIDRLQQIGKVDATNYPKTMFPNEPVAPTQTPTIPSPVYDPKYYTKSDVAKATNPPRGEPTIPEGIKYIGMQGDIPVFQYKDIGSFSVPKGVTYQQALANFKAKFNIQ
jgi:hypothetical protein